MRSAGRVRPTDSPTADLGHYQVTGGAHQVSLFCNVPRTPLESAVPGGSNVRRCWWSAPPPLRPRIGTPILLALTVSSAAPVTYLPSNLRTHAIPVPGPFLTGRLRRSSVQQTTTRTSHQCSGAHRLFSRLGQAGNSGAGAHCPASRWRK